MNSPVVDWNPETIARGPDFTRFLVLAELIRQHGSGRVLDIGCGTGTLHQLLPEFEYTGLDLSQKDIATAQERFPGADFLCADAETWQPSEAFGVTVFNESLYYLSDFRAALKRFASPLVCVSIYDSGMFSPNRAAYKIARRFIGERGTLLRDIGVREGCSTWNILVGTYGK